jgi:inorganic phosphate transporter, PiT family
VEVATFVAFVAVALFFDFTNGFHDAANAIATSVSTGALTPCIALAMAAVMNFVGALLGTGVAQTVGSGIIDTPTGMGGLLVVFGALIGAITWNLMPSSSSHALIGGLVGAAVAAGTGVKWDGIFDKVAIPMVVSPLVGFTVAFLLMVGLLWAFHRARPGPTNRGFRLAQSVSASAIRLLNHATAPGKRNG